MIKFKETYLGDGLYAFYDGFAVWLRAPRDGEDHVCALEPEVMKNFVDFVLSIERHSKIVRRTVNEIRRREISPNYDTTAERDMDRDGPGRDITDEQ